MKYPVQSLVVKVSNTCNLNCSYCYVFNRGDKHYVNIPKKLSKELCEKMFIRVKEHCVKNKLKSFTIGIHGGEPLLLGIPYYENFLNMGKEIFSDIDTSLFFVLQTNGTLMTDEWADFLTKNQIHVGFSIDGYENIHNINRVYRNNGKGSYQDVVAGMNIFKKYAPINALSVINTDSDPSLFYNTIKELELNSIGILFQDINHDEKHGIDLNLTSKWVIELFDIWFSDKNKGKLKLLTPFSIIINIILGSEWAGNDAYGVRLNDALLILTNGEIQVTGLEKPSIDEKGYYIQNDTIGNVFKKKIFRDYYNLHLDSVLCEQCKKCIIKEICGGGRYSHRYSSENGFNNPTAYCDVMKKIVAHIQNKVVNTIPEEVKKNSHIELLKYEEI